MGCLSGREPTSVVLGLWLELDCYTYYATKAINNLRFTPYVLEVLTQRLRSKPLHTSWAQFYYEKKPVGTNMRICQFLFCQCSSLSRKYTPTTTLIWSASLQNDFIIKMPSFKKCIINIISLNIFNILTYLLVSLC